MIGSRNQPAWLRDSLIAIAFLVGGFAIAWGFSPRGQSDGERRTANTESAQVVTTQGATTSGAGESAGEESAGVEPSDLAAFTQTLADLDSAPNRVEAFATWLNTLRCDDFEIVLKQLVSFFDEHEDEIELGAQQEEMLDWLFGGTDTVGTMLFERWALVAPDSLEKTLTTVDAELSAGLASAALPFLWGKDPARGRRILAQLRAGGEAFEDEFEPDVFVTNLYPLLEKEAVSFLIREGASDEIEELFSSGVSDPDGILPMLLGLEDTRIREGAIDVLFEAVSLRDPDAALALLDEFGIRLSEEQLAEFEPDLEHAWVRADPVARLDFENKPELARSVFEDWFLHKPEEALAWAEAVVGHAVPEKLMKAMVADQAMALPFDALMRHADFEQQLHLDDEWLRTLSMAQLDQLVERSPVHGVAELYRRDPQRAIDLAFSQESVQELLWLAPQVGADPERRSAWFEQVPEGMRPQISTAFFGNWAKEDPQASFDAASSYTYGQSAALTEWLKYEDPEEIYAMESGEIAGSDLLQAKLARTWAQHDPQTAGETLLADGLDAGIEPLVEEWLERDSVGASEFIRENMEPGESRDRAVADLVRAIAERDPTAAAEWAATIDGEVLRARALLYLRVKEKAAEGG